MFVFSLKASNLKKIILFILTAVLIITGSFLILANTGKGKNTAKNGASTKAETGDERIAFISSFGYEVNNEPLKVEEVIIPEEFDENYTSYNEMQKQQGFDLEKFKGCRVKKWTYEVTNFHEKENSGLIEVNLLIYNYVIIGADIQDLEQDGFIKALTDRS